MPRFARRLLHYSLGGFLAGFGLMLVHEPILRKVGSAWVVDESHELWERLSCAPVDAIVVLAGSSFSRPHGAADLYLKGVAPRVVITDVRIDPGALLMTPELDYATGTLAMRGVPVEALVLLETPVASTRDEAVVVTQWAREHGFRSIVVVTDPLHTRRSRWIFRKTSQAVASIGSAKRETEVFVVAAETRDYSLHSWWRSEVGLIDFQNEFFKYAYYRLRF